MSQVLPLRIEEGEVELRREGLDTVLPTPTQKDPILKFSYALYRRHDSTYLGMVRGYLQGEDNKLAAVECQLKSPEPHGRNYVSEALHALEARIDQGMSDTDAEQEKFEDYEIYL